MRTACHVCIITPGAVGSNPRVVKEAQALSEAGYKVKVICTRTLDVVDFLDQDVFAQARWRAQRLDFRPRWRWRVRRAEQMACARWFAATGWEALAHKALSPFTPALIAATKQVKADLYVAHYPAALPAAAIAAEAHGKIYAFDAEDFHLGESDGLTTNFDRALIRVIETRYLPGCSYVTAASPGIADAYADAYGIPRPTVILNVFPRTHAPPTATTKGTAVPGPSLYWVSQTIGPWRGLECATKAIARARSRPHLYIRGSETKGFSEHLRVLAAQEGVGDRLHLLPLAPPSKLEQLAAAYDVGLSGEPGHTPNNRLALGNKLFSYLLAGLPIAASSVSSHAALAQELGRAIRLYPVDDPDGLAAVLDSYLCTPAELAEARATAWKLGIERFNWEVEKVSLLDLVSNACHGAQDSAIAPSKSSL